MKTMRQMHKKTREHADTLAESIKAADDLEKIIDEEVTAGTLLAGSRKYNEATKALKDLRASIGLARRRTR